MGKIRPIALIAMILATTACHMRRPVQDNFLVDASKIGGVFLARSLSIKLRTKLESTTITLPDSDKAEIYSLYGNEFDLTLTPLPDDRCNTQAPLHSTYHQQIYRIDLIYKRLTVADRRTSIEKLRQAIMTMGMKLEKFKDCNLN